MLRWLQVLIGWVTLSCHLMALLYFADWFRKTDWGMGHFHGPPSSIIRALYTAVASVAGTAIWIAILLFRRFALPIEKQGKRRRLLVVQAVLLLLLFGPAAVIVAVGKKELPRAERQLHVQRLRSEDASVAELMEGLRSADGDLRFLAFQELEKRGPRSAAAVPILTERLKDAEDARRAARVLAAIGPDAHPAIPSLVESITREQGKSAERGRDRPSYLALEAGMALAEIGPASVPELVDLLGHEDRYVRMSAAIALGRMGPQARHAVSAMQDALNDDDESVRQCLHAAIEKIDNANARRMSEVLVD